MENIQLFDSHCHYNDEKFNTDREEVIKQNIEKGITKAVIAGYSLEGSKQAIQIAEKYPQKLYATVGISPNDVDNIDLNEIKEMAQNPKVVAIGEIGLDYYWNKENKELQKQTFINQIELANELNLPIVIHTREATIDTIQILKTNPVTQKGIFHCCPLNQELIKEATKLDYYISFSGNITFKNSKNADQCIKLVPKERILIETDSPYMTPEPLRGQRNTPANVKYTAQKIAEVLGLPLEEVAELTYQNALKIFNLK